MSLFFFKVYHIIIIRNIKITIFGIRIKVLALRKGICGR